MIILGCDVHKSSHTIVAIDAFGKMIEKITIKNTFEDFERLLKWAMKLEGQKAWGIENSQHYGKHLAQFLLNKGEQVYEVTPKLTAQLRGRSLKSDKSDTKDAIAIAKAVIQEKGNLHEVSSSHTAYAKLKELTRFRCSLSKKKTDFVNLLHKSLYHLDPEYKAKVGNITIRKGLNLVEKEYPCQETRIIVELIYALDKNIKDIEKQIKPVVDELDSPLSSLDGVGKIILATLLGEIGDIKNYKNAAQLASRSGISPLENSSAKNNYKRVNSGGNRRLNTAVHRIALYQIRKNELASNYYLTVIRNRR